MTEARDHNFRLGRWKVNLKAMVFIILTALLLLVFITLGLRETDIRIQRETSEPRPWIHALPTTNFSGNRNKPLNAVQLVKKIRLLCLILTMEKDLDTKVAAVNQTWATRCDKHLYIIHSKTLRSDFLNIDIPDNRNNLIYKMQEVYKEIYKKYMNDFDFLLKADDDTYVIVENLKFLLFHYDANEPGYLGFHFNKFVTSGYMSGGAGYVISNRGLRHLIERGYQKGLCEVKTRPDDPENSEDIETGRCLEAAGVKTWSSLDSEGRETFHAYTLERHLFGNLPGYIYSWAKYPMQKGKDCCSRYSISYHYVTPDAMLFLHHVLYETSVFGLNQDLTLKEPVFKTGNVT